MTIHICTAGTSIAGGPRRANETEEDYATRIDGRLQDLRAKAASGEELLIRAAAETNGLSRARTTTSDQVVLLATETADGRICADKLARLVEAELGCRARVVEIEGLQATDSRRFRTLGVRSLFQQLTELTRDQLPGEVRLNVTGGFKGTVPYVTLFGMFEGLSVNYVYEQSNALIALPIMPVEFDWVRLAQVTEALFAACDDILPEARWRELMPASYYGREADYDCLFEIENGLVTLSGTGLLLKRRLEDAESHSELWLSSAAKEAYDSAEGSVRSHFEFMLDRVRDPLFRNAFRHAERYEVIDLLGWKRGGRMGPRMLYWVENGQVFVGQLFPNHDRYDRHLAEARLQKAEYDRSRFIRFNPESTQDYAGSLRSIEEARLDEHDHLVALEEEAAALKVELQRLDVEKSRKIRQLEADLREARKAPDARIRKTMQEQARKIRELEGQRAQRREEQSLLSTELQRWQAARAAAAQPASPGNSSDVVTANNWEADLEAALNAAFGDEEQGSVDSGSVANRSSAKAPDDSPVRPAAASAARHESPPVAGGFILSPRFDDALAFASRAHSDQRRKGTSIPYVAHVLAVASLVLEHGGTEDQAIAALLHDTAEDVGGQAILDEIRTRFGEVVAHIVEECSDTLVAPKPPWRERKEAYLRSLPERSPESHLVSLADKHHNARSILQDLRLVGEDLWRRFNAPKADQLWYYRSLADAYARLHPHPLAWSYADVVAQIEALARGT